MRGGGNLRCKDLPKMNASASIIGLKPVSPMTSSDSAQGAPRVRAQRRVRLPHRRICKLCEGKGSDATMEVVDIRRRSTLEITSPARHYLESESTALLFGLDMAVPTEVPRSPGAQVPRLLKVEDLTWYGSHYLPGGDS